MVVAADIYKEILALYPTGVTVVTTADGAGGSFGLTLSAFASVSVDPPLVLICVAKSSNTLSAMMESRAFTVNILATGRKEVALGFASKDADKFLTVDFETLNTGSVLNSDAIAYLRCRIENEIEAGDHLVLIGLVEDAGILNDSDQPLLYWNREFWQMSREVPNSSDG